MADRRSSLKDAIMELAKEIDSVFKRYTKQTRIKAWGKITGKDGEREVKKILENPGRQLSPFSKLANQRESVTPSGLRVWLDDERPMPIDFDLHVKTADEAIKTLSKGGVSKISLDHDLGDESHGTGYDVAKFIERGAFEGVLSPVEVLVHSANPIGRRNMLMCLENARRFWNRT